MSKKLFIYVMACILSICLVFGGGSQSRAFAQAADYLDTMWVVNGRDLVKISTVNGRELLKKPDVGEVSCLALDSGSGDVWVVVDVTVGDKISRNVMRMDTGGNILSEVVGVKYIATDMDVNPVDGSLWVVAGQEVIHLDTAGNEVLRKKLDLSYYESTYQSQTSPVSSYFPSVGTVFPTTDFSWLYTGNYNPGYYSVKKTDSLCSIAINFKDNLIWCSTNRKGTILKLDPTGNQLWKKDLGEGNAASLSIDPADGSLWVSSKNKIVKYGAAGEKIFELALRENPSSGSSQSSSSQSSGYNYSNLSGLYSLGYLSNYSYLGGIWPSYPITSVSTSTVQYSASYPFWGYNPSWNTTYCSTPYCSPPFSSPPFSSPQLPFAGMYPWLYPYTVTCCTYTYGIPPVDVEALALDVADGSLWVVTDTDIVTEYSSSGEQENNLNILDLPQAVKEIAVNPLDGMVWIAGKTYLIKIDLEGYTAVLLRLSNFTDLRHIATYQDPFPPTVEIKEPADGSTVGSNTPNIIIEYEDQLAGVDTRTLQVKIDGADKTQLFTVTETGASYQITDADALAEGAHSVEVSIKDYARNQSVAAATFTVETSSVQALPSAFPTEGYAPLTVKFTDGGYDPQGTIEWYYWDFNADGSWDTSKEVPESHTYTFDKAGVYYPVHRVVSSTKQEAKATIKITVLNNPPRSTASANPSNGAVPLAVSFNGSGTDKDGTVALYEWDFDGNGTWDWSSTTTGNTSHTYASEGKHQAVFRVTDNKGAIGTANVATTAIRVGPPGSPTAKAKADKVSGNAPLTINFSDNGSFDPDGTISRYELDFDGDGTYDWSSATSGQVSHAYDAGGTFVAFYRVTDNAGLTGIDVVSIDVGIQATLSIGDADLTFNPSQKETMAINTTISGKVPVTILIRNRAGDVVRTLVDNVSRAAGTYNDLWDGMGDSSQPVPDGVYYAVLKYKLGDQDKEVDLTNTTGGGYTMIEPSSSVVGRHDPFQDDFVKNDFSLTKASEITFFAGDWVNNSRVRTVINREPYPAGSNSLYWDGLDDRGNIAKPVPGGKMICGILCYELPNNAMYVTGGKPIISKVSIEPNYYSPLNESCLDGGDLALLSYHLSEAATVEVEVWNLNTIQMVRRISQDNVTEGDHTIVWDGQNDQGTYVDAGEYRLAIRAVDSGGNTSMIRYALIKLTY